VGDVLGTSEGEVSHPIAGHGANCGVEDARLHEASETSIAGDAAKYGHQEPAQLVVL
jgi:2-polyprenyl-6-methoxyphenol hydroxylase-like FAD-dependent oxidoreductase